MGRRRKKDKHLPARVYLRSGTYYFVCSSGKWINLGKNYPVALRKVADFVEPAAVTTMGTLFDRYGVEVIPAKAPKTQKENHKQMKCLRLVFGDMLPRDIRPKHLYAFLDKRSKYGLTQANREFELLSHCLTKAVEWGVIERNPARQVRRAAYRPKKRNRYVTDGEFWLVHSVATPAVQIAMEIAVLTGLRRADILALNRDSMAQDGIHVDTSKTGKRIVIQWSTTLSEVVDRAWKISPRVRRHLIVNLRGNPYTSDGFSSQWTRAIDKALKAGLEERFTFHDLRAKSASDDTLEVASKRLGHFDARVTERYYRRRPEVVRPLR